MDIFDIEIDYEDVDLQIPQEELEEVFGNISDYGKRKKNGTDMEYLMGITVSILQEILETELFSLLENSMKSASRKIVTLLNSNFSSETNSSSSILWKNNLKILKDNTALNSLLLLCKRDCPDYRNGVSFLLSYFTRIKRRSFASFLWPLMWQEKKFPKTAKGIVNPARN